MMIRTVAVLILAFAGPLCAQLNVSGLATSAAYTPAISTAEGTLGNLAPVSTAIVNVTGAGILNEIRARVVAPIGNPVCAGSLVITVDGGAPVTVALFDGVTGAWPAALLPLQTWGTAGGTAAGDTVSLAFHQTYKTSLNITWNGDACGGAAGTVRVSVLRGVRI